MKIAVSGASGHVGNVVCRKLIEKGCKVKAFYNSDSRSLQNLDLKLVQGNVLNKSDLSKSIEYCDFVINCAAIISINGDRDGLVFKTNTEGPKNILEVAIKYGVKKIIHVSSVHAVHDLRIQQFTTNKAFENAPGTYNTNFNGSFYKAFSKTTTYRSHN